MSNLLRECTWWITGASYIINFSSSSFQVSDYVLQRLSARSAIRCASSPRAHSCELCLSTRIIVQTRREPEL